MDFGTPILVIMISPNISKKRTVRAKVVSNFIAFFICKFKAKKILLVLKEKSNYNGGMKKQMGKVLIMASIFALIDQFTKWLAVKHLESPIRIIWDFFMLEYAENKGMAFGIPLHSGVLLAISVFLLAVIIYIANRELKLDVFLSRFCAALIIGGALGNIIDRIVNGYVVDFIKIWKWPNFNLADVFIVVGILLTIIFYGKIVNDERKN